MSMTEEELAHNVAKCYNSLPDKGEDAMETLISTIALFIQCNVNEEESSIDEAIMYFRNVVIEDVESFVESLEIKEVDLDKELNDFIEGQNACVKDDRVVEYNNGDSFNHIYDLASVAKHFFELGLKESCPITANDRGMAEEIIINLKRIEKDYRIDLTKEIEWLRNKVKKGGDE